MTDEPKELTDHELLLEIKKSVFRTEDKLARIEQNYIELLAKIGKGVK